MKIAGGVKAGWQTILAAGVATLILGGCTTVDAVRRDTAKMNVASTQAAGYQLMHGNNAFSGDLYLKATRNDTKWTVQLADKPFQWIRERGEEIFVVDTQHKQIRPMFERLSVGTAGAIPVPAEPISCSFMQAIATGRNKYTVCSSVFSQGDGQVDWAQMGSMLVSTGAIDQIEQRAAQNAAADALAKAATESRQNAERAAQRKAELEEADKAARIRQEYKRRTLAKLKTLPVGSSIECTVYGTSIMCPDLAPLESNEFNGAVSWRVMSVKAAPNGQGSLQVFKRMQ